MFLAAFILLALPARINGESTSMVWPTLGSRTAKEQEQELPA